MQLSLNLTWRLTLLHCLERFAWCQCQQTLNETRRKKKNTSNNLSLPEFRPKVEVRFAAVRAGVRTGDVSEAEADADAGDTDVVAVSSGVATAVLGSASARWRNSLRERVTSSGIAESGCFSTLTRLNLRMSAVSTRFAPEKYR